MAKESRFTKRQLKKLIKEQTGIVRKDPNNLVARLKLAGALKDLGKDSEAVTHYQEVAKAYASTGKLVQAISVYKGILEIKPGHEHTEAALTELSTKRAQELEAKSMPHLQQQDDSRWVMPPQSKSPGRQTLLGVPAPETPDMPETPLPAVTHTPRGIPTPTSVVSPVDNKRTVQMEREPDMAPAQEPQPPDESAEETLVSIFDDEEEAFWSELEGVTDEAEATAQRKPIPRTKPKSTLRSALAPAASAMQAPALPVTQSPRMPRSGKAKTARKSSKMTIPMGAAAFKKAVEEQESQQQRAVDEESERSAPRSESVVQLEEIALFRDLSETSREMLQSRLVRRTEKRGTIIVREGDPGNALFVVSSGQVRVTKQNRQGNKVSLATLGPGAFFGEFALLSDRKRHATVTVSEDGVVFEISRKVIADLTKSDPSFGNTLRQFYRRRLLGTMVRSAPFFDPLSEKEREALMSRLRFRRIPEKTKIITEGEPGGGFFLILIGEVDVTKTQPDGSEKVLSRLTDGSYFGEMSLLKGGNAVATVTTVTPTEIVQLAAAEFYRILSKYPQIWEEVNREAKRRELANLQILSGRTPDQPSDDSVVM